MRISGLRRYVLSSCVPRGMLAARGGAKPPIGAPGATVSDTPFSLSVRELRSIEEA
jgi:hypothetical protein